MILMKEQQHSTAQHKAQHTAEHTTGHDINTDLVRNIAKKAMLQIEPFGMILSLNGMSLVEVLLVPMEVTGHRRCPSFITMLKKGSCEEC